MWPFGKTEERATNISNEAGVASSDPRIAELFGFFGVQSASGVSVTTESALGVPAVWGAVNFLAGTIAGLPLRVYRRTGQGRDRVTGSVASLLHDAVNDGMSSFDWRKYTFEQCFTGGRAFTLIERNPSGTPINLFPLDPAHMKVRRERGVKWYELHEEGRVKRYEPAEIIDLPFMLRSDGLTHRGPIASNRDILGLAIAATRYGSRFFENGGVPPFAVTGPFQSGQALSRASDDLHEAVKNAAKDGRQALTLPSGLEIRPIGADPEKSQLVETQRFLIEQIARIYSLPPTFLQDLTNGTYSNTEQEDIRLVKHTLKRWAEQFEQELNLKLFGRGRQSRFAELNMDGVLRGDFATRMEGNARAIMTGQLTPNEARRMDNRPDMPNGNRLYIQGATVPLGTEAENGTT